MRLPLALTLVCLLSVPVASHAEAVTSNLEEVSAEQQMFCVPSIVYDEEGEIVGGGRSRVLVALPPTRRRRAPITQSAMPHDGFPT